jgi:hypothetical protein
MTLKNGVPVLQQVLADVEQPSLPKVTSEVMSLVCNLSLTMLTSQNEDDD